MVVRLPAMKLRGQFEVTEYTNPATGTTSYRVTGTRPDGTRVRENYKLKAEAVGRKGRLEIEALGSTPGADLKTTRLTQAELSDAEGALLALRAASKQNGSEGLASKTLSDAVSFLVAHYRPSKLQVTVKDAYDRFLVDLEKAGRRPLTIRNLKVRVGHLVEAHGSKLVNEVIPSEVNEVIDQARGRHVARGILSRHNERRALSRFFEWAKAARYCESNPCEGTIAPDLAEIKARVPHILTAAEAEKLVGFAVGFKEGKLAPYVTLALFAALRPEELSRLSWQDIDLKRKVVTIRVDVAKTKSEREVELSPNAVQLLTPFAATRPEIVPANFQKNFDTIKEHAGYGTPDPKDQERKHLRPWAQDTLRHTAASFRFALVQDEGKVATWCGHSVTVLRRHYKRLIGQPGQVKRFWAIGSPAKAGKLVPMPKSAAA